MRLPAALLHLPEIAGVGCEGPDGVACNIPSRSPTRLAFASAIMEYVPMQCLSLISTEILGCYSKENLHLDS